MQLQDVNTFAMHSRQRILPPALIELFAQEFHFLQRRLSLLPVSLTAHAHVIAIACQSKVRIKPHSLVEPYS